MSEWENRLRNLAHGGESWDLPAQEELDAALESLRPVLRRAATDHGLTGESGIAASESLSEAAKEAARLKNYLVQVKSYVARANELRRDAATRLQELGSGGLTPEQEALVRGAATGATIPLGPISIIAGEGAVQAANWFFGNRRESQAQKAVEEISDRLDGLTAPEPLEPPPPVGPGGTAYDGPEYQPVPVPPPGNRSFENYPNFNVNPMDQGSPGSGGAGAVIVPVPGQPPVLVPQPPGTTTPTPPVFPTPTTPTTPTVPTPPDLTPDGPISGGVPGPGTQVPSPGGLGGGTGGLTSGLIAGAGGAAALGGLGRAAAAGGLGRLGGLGGLGGLAGAGGAGGVGGAGGAGGLGRAGGMAGGLTANAGGAGAGTGGGMLGARGGGATGAVGAGADGGVGRGGTAMMGGGGAPAGAGGRSEKRGRGLGGPIAPKIEDDEDFGPRSENAGAGGRD